MSEDRKFKNNIQNTKVLVPEEIDIIINSNPADGASNVSSDGSSFNIALEEGLRIPSDAKNVNISCEEATIWFTTPNITTGTNDKLYISAPNEATGLIVNYTVVLPQGLYDLNEIRQAVQRELANQGAKITPSPVITFTADDSTQKVEMVFNYANTSVDFTNADTIRTLLGFNSSVVGPSAGAITYLADNVASFNQVNYFLIHSDLVSKGVRINNKYSQAISQVLIDVQPGEQIVNKPFHPAKSNGSFLAGNLKRSIKFWLTDDLNRPVNTNGEYWSARVKITFLHAHYI